MSAYLVDGHDAAFLGYVDGVACYDANVIIDTLMRRDGMTYEEAIEFFDFNIAGSCLGPGMPVYLWRMSLQEFQDTVE